jgi:hypothetical protein
MEAYSGTAGDVTMAQLGPRAAGGRAQRRGVSRGECRRRGQMRAEVSLVG